MSAIIDFLNKVLGKQDETLTAVGSIAKDFDAIKASASEKDAKIIDLTSALDSMKAELDVEKAKAAKLEADLAAEQAAHKATAESVEKQAAAKAAAITQSIGQPPVPAAANPLPADSGKETSQLKGLARVAADINKQLGNRK